MQLAGKPGAGGARSAAPGTADRDQGTKPGGAPPTAPKNPVEARREAAQDLLWALLTAREFYFNH